MCVLLQTRLRVRSGLEAREGGGVCNTRRLTDACQGLSIPSHNVNALHWYRVLLH